MYYAVEEPNFRDKHKELHTFYFYNQKSSKWDINLAAMENLKQVFLQEIWLDWFLEEGVM